MKTCTPLGVFLLCLVGLCAALPVPFQRLTRNVSKTENSTRPFAEDCQEYCSLTYPVHTYPEPSHFKACASGCRSAQLDAFIAWPLQSDPGRCEHTCGQMYSEGDQRYACTTGCQTPTIDSAFPNRSHLYKNNNTEVVDRAFPSVENTISYLFNSFFSLDNSVSFDDLTEHAQNMELLVVPYLRSDITILTNDGVYSYREYSFDNGDSILTDAEGTDTEEGSLYNFSPVTETSWLDRYRQHHKTGGCMWRLHRVALHKLLCVLSGGLIVAALVTCFLSACSSEEKKKVAVKRVPPAISAFDSSPALSTKKAPYDVGSEFIVPEKGAYRQVHQKITML